MDGVELPARRRFETPLPAADRGRRVLANVRSIFSELSLHACPFGFRRSAFLVMCLDLCKTVTRDANRMHHWVRPKWVGDSSVRK